MELNICLDFIPGYGTSSFTNVDLASSTNQPYAAAYSNLNEQNLINRSVPSTTSMFHLK